MRIGGAGGAQNGNMLVDGAVEAPLEASTTPAGGLEAAIGALGDGFVLFDRADRLVLCNDRYREFYALSAPALVPGARFEDILRYGLERGQYAAAAGREAAWLEERLRDHCQASATIEEQLCSGRHLRVTERATPEGGRVGSCVDVTLAANRERRLDAIIAGTNVGTWEWEVQTGRVLMNERWAEIVGYRLEELEPVDIETWYRLLHPDDVAPSDAAIQAHFRGETPFYECEVRLRHRAGHWVWVLDQGRVASRTAAGLPEWMSGTHLDITLKRASQARLEASHDRLDQLLQASPATIYAVDVATWQPTYVSGNCVDLHRCSAADILGTPDWWRDRLHPDDGSAVLERVGAWLTAGGEGSLRHAYRMRRADGRYIWLEDRLRALRDATGRLAEIVGSSIDVTERKRLEESFAAEHAFLDRILATSVSAVIALDGTGTILFANAAAERMLGVEASEVGLRRYDDPAWRITDIDGRKLAADELPFARVLATGAPVQDVRHAITRPDGTRRIFSVNAAPLPASPDSTARVVCSLTDMTERLAAECALARQEALFRTLFELCPVGIALNDFRTGRFLDVNAALSASTGYTRDELLELDYLQVTPKEYHPLEELARRSLLEHGRYGPLEKDYIRKDGSRYPVLLNGIMVKDLAGRPLTWSIVEDISERKANEARILKEAHHDPLTGLANRRLFGDRMATALERARRGHTRGAVLMLDLDHFKPVNDTLGHGAGDAILIEAARRLVACTRQTDTVARFGGDEFVILLDDVAAADAILAIAQKIKATLNEPYEVEGQRVRLSVTIGIARLDGGCDDPAALVRLADAAMYEAKRSGRDAIRLHRPRATTGRRRPVPDVEPA